MTKVKALMGWDNKGTLQHMAKMSYMTERTDRMEGLGVSTSVCLTLLLVRDLPNVSYRNASCCRVLGGEVESGSSWGSADYLPMSNTFPDFCFLVQAQIFVKPKKNLPCSSMPLVHTYSWCKQCVDMFNASSIIYIYSTLVMFIYQSPESDARIGLWNSLVAIK